MKEWFWTDSKVVIDYIKNDARTFKTIVFNRVQQIRENTNVKQWCYVPTRENPDGRASRGLNVVREHSGDCWFQGTPFLWQNENNWSCVNGAVELKTLN